MDKAAEKICKSCYECQLVAYPYPLELLTSMILPKGPQPDQAIDLLQPLPSGPSILLVINYYGHYHEYVEVILLTTWKRSSAAMIFPSLPSQTVTLIKTILRIMQAEWHCAS